MFPAGGHTILPRDSMSCAYFLAGCDPLCSEGRHLEFRFLNASHLAKIGRRFVLRVRM